jgi:hypothetical protein
MRSGSGGKSGIRRRLYQGKAWFYELELPDGS